MFQALVRPREPNFVGGVADKRRRKPEEARRLSLAYHPPAILAAILLASVSTTALAADPPVHVPAINPAAPLQTASADPAPKRWPPPLPLLSPSARLGPKERHGLALVHRWRSRHVMPAMGPRGEVRFLFGATMPTVVCSPMEICNISLQAGEVVTHIDLGDSVMWKVSPAVSGSGANQVTHLIIKPRDAGLHTTMDVETNRRTYAIRLVSTRFNFMPLVAFNYPDDAAAAWSAYQQTMGVDAGGLDTYANSCRGGIWVPYAISGDDPSWRPIGAWTNGRKTCVALPASVAFGTMPVLEKLNNDGGFFHGPSTSVINYRKDRNYLIFDGVLNRAVLIAGQMRVVLTRAGE